MMRARLILGVVLCSVYALAEAESGKSSAAVANAAVKYLRAAASLRQSCPLPLDGWSKLEKAVEQPLNSEDEQIVACAAEALTEFEHGSSLPACDWQVSFADGPMANTAHRGVIRELAAIAVLRARLRVRDGDKPGAIADIIGALTAARHLSLDGSIASVLFGYSIEERTSEILSELIGKFSSIELDQLESGLLNLPKVASMRQAVESEKLARNDLRDVVAGVHNRDELIGVFAAIPALKNDRQKVMRIVDSCGGSMTGILSCIDQQTAFYERWVPRFDLPPERFESEFSADFSASSSDNAVIATFTPLLPRLRWAEAYSETGRALVLAAVAVRIHGVKALPQYPDPYDGRPFTYQKLADGFQLQSNLQKNETRLSISVH